MGVRLRIRASRSCPTSTFWSGGRPSVFSPLLSREPGDRFQTKIRHSLELPLIQRRDSGPG